jgi:hypothetical protein
MLRAFGRDLWLAEGPTVSFLGFPYATRMAAARLPDASVWLWSPVEPSPALLDAVRALGEVREIVSPNKLHHLFLGAWAEAFPQARLHAPPGLARKRPDLHFAAELGDTPDPAWGGAVDTAVFRGSLAMEEVVFFHRPSRTALVGDLIQRADPASFRGWRRLVMRLDGLLGPDGSTPREWRATFWRRGAARAALRKALAWQPERLVVAHGDCVAEGGREALAQGLRWLA